MPTLTWAGKEHATKEANSVPYRLLERDESLCYGDATAGNVIVQGDNLAALKALMPYYRGRVRCIYIDPPYNTHSAFEHYDDSVEHSTWLSLMYPRLELLREMLSEDGSIWISIDDNEAQYMRVICDEIFGRSNFVCTIIWEKRKSRENRRAFSFKHDYIFVYAKFKKNFEEIRNPVQLSDTVLTRYKNPDNDSRGVWQSVAITAQSGHATPSQFYDIITPSGRRISPPPGNCWRFTQPRFEELVNDNRIWFGKNGNNVPRQKMFLAEQDNAGLTPETIWYADDVGTNDSAKRHSNELFGQDGFDNPKPEQLLQRILQIATNPGDLVLDSFLGSGTTAAVAQKMNRHYVGIEIGEHAVTHVVPRLRKVIDGEEGGISKAENWQGGGGFSFYRLGEEVFTADGQIRKDVTFQTLAAHLWMKATDTPYGSGQPKESDSVREIMSTYGHDSPLLGIHEGTAYYLLYNGILGDRRPDGGNVLTKKVLAVLPPHDGPRIIYGENSRLHEETLKALGIVFRQIPKEIPAN